MYSHEELINAVSAAGRDGKTFTVKDVRTHLGFDSRDKKELSRFRRRLRAFEKAAADQLEKLGNNSYRLRGVAFAQSAPEPAPAAIAASAETTAPVAEPAPAEISVAAAIAAHAETTAPVAEPARVPATPSAATNVVPSESAAPVASTAPVELAARVAVEAPAHVEQESEMQLEPASGVFQSAVPANEPEAQPQTVREAPALHVVEPLSDAHTSTNAHASTQAAYVATPPHPHEHSVSTPQRVLSVAGALVSSAFAASAAMSGKVRERGRNLREQLWSCVRSAPARKHAFARLRGWAESVRPLSNEVREQLTALRQRVLASRRRAA